MGEINIVTTDGFSLALYEINVENPKAVIQLVHGAKEYKKRYYEFMEYLASKGFAVIISDIRGHGFSVSERCPLGHMEGVKRLVSDQVTVAKYIKDKYKDIPHYMFGHSMGSMIARCFIKEYDDKIDKLVLSGAANYLFGAKTVTAILKVFSKDEDKYEYTLNPKLAKISNNPLLSSDISWLCNDRKVIDNFRDDQLCGKDYDNSGISTVLELNALCNKTREYKCYNSNLEILFVSGEDDVITGGPKGLVSSINTLLKAGYSNIDYKVYDNMKHEILNETEKETVYLDIIKFLNGEE